MPWWSSLRVRTLLLLVSLALVTLGGGTVTIWYTHHMEALFTRSVEKEVAAALQGEALLRALIEERGFVSYYFMDGNPEWLERLHEQRKAFRHLLEGVRKSAATTADREKLGKVEERYEDYVESKDRVIDLYRSGRREEGQVLHQEVRAHFQEILDLVEAYEATNVERLQRTQKESKRRATWMHAVAAAAVLVTVLLSLVLAFVLLRQIFGPIQVLVGEAERFGGGKGSSDEVKALGRGVRSLIEDADLTHQELEKSRTILLQTEKMAMVGRLAAGVAHSIRNPLTSIKMRLFSLERSLDLPPTQKEDLEVISEETRHIDTIVSNFLEYSRPSKLRMQKISPSALIDTNLQLLRHRFKSYGVHLEQIRLTPLPEILGDPDQLKEVFVNILINACEATGEGGSITIAEEQEVIQTLGPAAVIRIHDNGPGVPAELRERIFEPFFTTKAEGTGLGLSIAARLIEQHGGRIALESGEGTGTTFVITLPCGTDRNGTQT